MNKKLKIVDVFISELNQKLYDKIYNVYLFGSVAKGSAHKGSDIDILIIHYNECNKIEEVVNEICFEIGCKFEEVPEVVLMSYTEYKKELGKSPFLFEVLNYGKPLIRKENNNEWKPELKEYLILAEEYLSYAKEAIKEGKIRLSIDTAYNSAELLCKILIMSTGNKLASSHGGIIGQFSKLFVMSGKIKCEIGKNLNKALELRAKARYKPKSELTLKEANFVFSLAQELLEFAKSELKSN